MSVKRGETKRRKYWVPCRGVLCGRIYLGKVELVGKWGRGLIYYNLCLVIFETSSLPAPVRVCSIYSNTIKWSLRDMERGRH